MHQTTLLLIVFLSPVLDGVAVALVLFCSWEKLLESDATPCLSFPRVLLAAGAGAAVFLFKLPILVVLGLDFFGLMHIVYLDLVITIPALGVVVLIMCSKLGRSRPRLPATPIVRVLAVLSLFAIAPGIYGSLIEPFRLRLEHAVIPVKDERVGSGELRIGVLADIQTDGISSFEHEALDALLARKPDIIVLPGDFFQAPESAVERGMKHLQAFFRRLHVPVGVYAVLGNADIDVRRVRQMFEGSKVRLLENEVVRVRVKGWELTIAGLDVDYDSAAAAAAIAELENSPGEEDFRLLLCHYPDVIEGLSRSSRVDLVVSGHTHGGQVCLPGFGPLLTLSRVPRHVAAGGYHEIDGRRIYVSRGLGMERAQAPRIRVFCPPEVSVLDLTKDVGGTASAKRSSGH